MTIGATPNEVWMNSPPFMKASLPVHWRKRALFLTVVKSTGRLRQTMPYSGSRPRASIQCICMLDGNKGAAGVPEKMALKLPYTNRYPKVKCMLILSAGAGTLMCHGVRKRAERNLKFNGFIHLGTVVIDGTYSKKEKALIEKQRRKIVNICKRASIQ